MYIIKSRYYSSPDQFGESFVVTSDNGEKDLKLGNGTKVKIVAICSNCENDALISYGDGTCLCGKCMIKKRREKELK